MSSGNLRATSRTGFDACTEFPKLRFRLWCTKGDDLAKARDLAVVDALVSIGRADAPGKRLHEVYATPSTTTGALPRNGLNPRRLAVLALDELDTGLELAV